MVSFLPLSSLIQSEDTQTQVKIIALPESLWRLSAEHTAAPVCLLPESERTPALTHPLLWQLERGIRASDCIWNVEQEHQTVSAAASRLLSISSRTDSILHFFNSLRIFAGTDPPPPPPGGVLMNSRTCHLSLSLSPSSSYFGAPLGRWLEHGLSSFQAHASPDVHMRLSGLYAHDSRASIELEPYATSACDMTLCVRIAADGMHACVCGQQACGPGCNMRRIYKPTRIHKP